MDIAKSIKDKERVGARVIIAGIAITRPQVIAT
jgi:hypothetical protein